MRHTTNFPTYLILLHNKNNIAIVKSKTEGYLMKFGILLYFTIGSLYGVNILKIYNNSVQNSDHETHFKEFS